MPIAGPLRDELIALSRGIHGEPELAYQERRAVARIATVLEAHGHTVERDCGGIETAFRARVGPTGKVVTLLAEYDALPEIGHGCGHNLIAMSTVGAFLLAAEAARTGGLEIGVELVGTPAEESGGGKLDLIDAGAFADTVSVLSSHPGGNWWGVGQTTLGIVNLRIGFHGLAAHAAVSPEAGRNALSAAVRLFVAIDGWRQHLPGDARVHGIITNGGAASNIIPSYAEAVIGLRAADVHVLRGMIATFRDIVQGCALQTGTTAEIREEMRLYEPTDSDPLLTRLLVEDLQRQGKAPIRQGNLVTASTDLGNVSQRWPTAAVGFPVSTDDVPGHSIRMTEASVSDFAHEAGLATAEALAAVALRLATDETARRSLRSRP
ncbi:MAG TPA: amidohydrolase [Candidatus Saccharimonadales bacterium]|nr:amidohydrolase [Candidatus Saccharimonadales bacterium]